MNEGLGELRCRRHFLALFCALYILEIIDRHFELKKIFFILGGILKNVSNVIYL